MIIEKKKLLDILEPLPEKIDTDEVLYLINLLSKMGDSELDIENKRLVTHEELKKETEKWFSK